MENWFTVEQLDKDEKTTCMSYVISEYQHWEETHCYLLCGTKKAVLIDTGLGVPDIKKVVEKLTDLPIMVVTTHVHWDHIGGHQYFDNIAVHEKEYDWMAGKFPLPLQIVKNNLLSKLCEFPPEFNIDEYQIFQGKPQSVLRDGDYLDLGNRKIQVIHTPGHSPGHCCFYEPEKRYLYTGDLIYKGCLDMYYPSTNPDEFKESVDKISKLKINRIFPGHHELHISTEMVKDVQQAFHELERTGKLSQGNGIFDFGEFQIHM